MEAYLLDWAGLVLRWAHLVAGIAWIGASFYFIWLDDSLEPPKRAEDRARGVAGELWAVHGGGFYRAEKYALAPPELPERLHWFKWEAYWTWITGFALLVLLYYANAETYLIDPQVMPLAKSQAIGLGLGSLVVGVAVYEGLCRSPLGRNDAALAAALLLFLAALAWALTQVFGGRGAFIHYGAVIGTIMAANVGHIIIPGQRELVRAMREGRPPDPKFAIAGKQRSVHNTYLTLPVLFTMISSHYATAFASRWNWLVLVALTVAGALVRVWFVMRHKGRPPAWPLAAAAAIFAALLWLLAPRESAPAGPPVAFAEVERVIVARCASCHAARPAFPGLAEAPKGVLLDTPERIRQHASAIHQQTVLARAMPPGNVSAMSEEERVLLDRWYRAGARTP
ncbi:MAG: urate hydroxylase PuuD [Burkholderiales bacterium]|nr:urate hydroxylase PuuD [Burkholderiales bacterium]